MKKKFIVVFFLLLVLTGCRKETVLKAPSNIVYDGNYLTWDVVDNADSYEIIINQGTPILSEVSRVSYDANNLDFEVTITAMSSSDAIASSISTTKPFTYLGPVNNLRYEDDRITWDQNPNATSYLVRFNNGDPVVAQINEVIDVPIDKNVVQVRPVNINDTGYYGKWTESYQYTVLRTPTNIEYDSSMITWSSVQNAQGYMVKINHDEFYVQALQYPFVTDQHEDLSISVKAVGDEVSDVFNSPFSEERVYVQLEPIRTVTVQDGILNWDQIENATHYQVEVTSPTGTTTHEVDRNSYSNLAANTQYQVRIFALSKTADNYFSSWSNPLNVRILSAPVVQYSDGAITWNAVSGASGYSVDLYKGTEKIETRITSSEGSYGFIYEFEAEGQYTFQVKSVGSSSDSGVYDSRYSESYTIVRLGAPTGIQLEHDVNSSSSARVRYNSVAYADGYKLYLDGVAMGIQTSSTLINIAETATPILVEKSWQVSVQSIGGYHAASRMIVLDSQPSIPMTLVKLGVPVNTDITNGVFSWMNVDQNSGYSIALEESLFLNAKDDTDYDISFVEAGSFTVKVRALGNGSNVISSGYSSITSFTKLRKPELTVNNGLIQWKSIMASTGYQYSVNQTNGTFNNTVLQYQITNADLINNSAVFNIYAKGNGSNVLDSNASTTDTLMKLSSPSIRITDDTVSWENVPFATTYDFFVNETVFKSAITGTSFQTTELPAGAYVFSVIARGDIRTKLSSDQSNELSVSKLASPTLSMENDVYTWDHIAGAEKYVISIMESEYQVYTNMFDPYPYFTKAQTYKVDIQAVNEGTGFIDSMKSSVNQVVSNLVLPDLNYEVTDRTLTITMIDQSSMGRSFYLFINGNEIELESDTYQFSADTGNYQLGLAVKGGVFSEGTYYKDSLAKEFGTVTFLPSPTNIQVIQPNLNLEIYTMSWNAVNGASSYLYAITSGGLTVLEGQTNVTSVTGIDLSSYTDIVITIKAIGNQTTTFDSLDATVNRTLND
jgi:hypothetical protein